ncbi:response regulator [Sphingomonas jatrophae]|uniref:Two-component system, OmpR family, response regulator n=1 Tax=Sphingomonas jatrophae TaxID=1166337 RepID=A0A1I6JVT0_9SPHN|nr:response regulator [Sphingomonas jatrophae]SFR83046.1 two-component system, OmpR family, response regulator [Sphingomonas jatrophae]
MSETMPVPPRILVVDDDAELRTLIAEFLEANGMAVQGAGDARAMDAALAAGKFDLIVLDLMLPGEDGLSILRRMRGPGRPAIIMLSAMGEDTDRIIGLEVGADDYLPKPCNPRELLARVRAVLRRREDGPVAGPMRRFGDWTLDLVGRELRRPGQASAQLTDAEFRVLTAFLDRPQRVLNRDQLIEAGKGQDSDVYDRAIDVTISRLRKKLGPGDPIRTVRNEGYMFTLAVSEG